MRYTIEELAERLGGSIEGDGGVVVTGVASLESAGPGDLTFVVDARRASALAASRAAAAILGGDAPTASMPVIRVENVEAALATVLAMVGESEKLPPAGIHPTAIVAGDAQVGPGVAIGPGAVVGAGAKLGPSVALCANVTVGPEVTIGAESILLVGTVVEGRCRIGRRCRIGPNAVIGSSGFGYYFANGRRNRVPHTGTVEIGDDVDIGACSCVDRAKFGATRIGDGTKIDNLVQVAHNVQIGRRCALAALVGIAGSAVLKDDVVLGGHVGVRDNITVGSNVQSAACSAIAQDTPEGAAVSGIPAIDARQWLRSVRLFARLSEMHERIKQLEKKVKALESPKDHQDAG
jgi:UDP-3-O-[3-hydroxymyristoyl] glucosamine N-acyltransferase